MTRILRTTVTLAAVVASLVVCTANHREGPITAPTARPTSPTGHLL